MLLRYRELLYELVKRDLTDRYAGQWLGVVWVVAHPLLLIGIYVFVFVYILDIRFGSSAGLSGNYASYILSGLIPWLAFYESMNKSCMAVTGQSAFVKQLVFPVGLLPLKTVFASCITLVVLLLGMLGYRLMQLETLPLTALLLPILISGQLICMAGAAYFLASVAVYFRDVKDIVHVFGMIIIYLTPILYLPDWMPEGWKVLLYANPFTYMVWCYQDALYYGYINHPLAWMAFMLGSCFLFNAGYACFKTLQPRFGNVL